MSKKNRETNSRVVAALATAGAVLVTRKVVTFAWTHITGKQPPNAADPAVSIAQALSWAVLTGITVETARVFATRATARRPAPGDAGGAESS
jgi:Protein of unknown function (DUF4235)